MIAINSTRKYSKTTQNTRPHLSTIFMHGTPHLLICRNVPGHPLVISSPVCVFYAIDSNCDAVQACALCFQLIFFGTASVTKLCSSAKDWSVNPAGRPGAYEGAAEAVESANAQSLKARRMRFRRCLSALPGSTKDKLGNSSRT